MPKKKPKKWIQKAIKRPGALTAKAKAQGMTVAQYCSQGKEKLSSLSQRQCNLYKTLKRF
jgi:hypothetical protein